MSDPDRSRELRQANARIAELEALVSRLDSEGMAMGTAIAELEATLNGLADLWPAAPTSIGTTREWDAGFVAGLEAFRASIRRTIAERPKT